MVVSTAVAEGPEAALKQATGLDLAEDAVNAIGEFGMDYVPKTAYGRLILHNVNEANEILRQNDEAERGAMPRELAEALENR